MVIQREVPFRWWDYRGQDQLNSLGAQIAKWESENSNSDVMAKNPAFSRHVKVEDKY